LCVDEIYNNNPDFFDAVVEFVKSGFCSSFSSVASNPVIGNIISDKHDAHGKLKYNCADCNPCAHGKLKRFCADCNPCPHGTTLWSFSELYNLFIGLLAGLAKGVGRFLVTVAFASMAVARVDKRTRRSKIRSFNLSSGGVKALMPHVLQTVLFGRTLHPGHPEIARASIDAEAECQGGQWLGGEEQASRHQLVSITKKRTPGSNRVDAD